MRNTTLLLVVIASVSFLFSNTGEATNDPNDPFKIKGFHLDLRIQVMQLEALKELADELAANDINTLIMEWEGTFPFESHPLITNRFAYTKEEISQFIAYCQGLDIDVIPLQQSLGHLEYVLRHSRYANNREDSTDVSQVCPLQTELNKALFVDLITEMAEVHPSKYIHVGGDEAYLFGQCGKCQEHVAREGKSALLSGHLKLICDIVVSMGKIPVLWADIATKYPDELNKLPRETVFIIWNYGWALDRFGDPEEIASKGFEVWGAPSLRSGPDNFFLTKWDKHFNNIRDFIPHCRESGYDGIIMTSWSTSGIYSAVFEDKQTISDLIPVRHVYPLSGFHILIKAYGEAIHQKEPLIVIEFIKSYCRDRFGFDEDQSVIFWNALRGTPLEVIDGVVSINGNMTIAELLENAKRNQIALDDLRPLRNQEEFSHFRLMAGIRENYLAFKHVESIANQEDFTSESIPGLIDSINEILRKDGLLKQEFTELQTGFLHPEQIEEENRIRIKRVENLYKRLINRITDNLN